MVDLRNIGGDPAGSSGGGSDGGGDGGVDVGGGPDPGDVNVDIGDGGGQSQPPGGGPETVEDPEPSPPDPGDVESDPGGGDDGQSQPPGGGPETIEDPAPPPEPDDPPQEGSQPPGGGPETVEDPQPAPPSPEDVESEPSGGRDPRSQPPGAGPATIEDPEPTQGIETVTGAGGDAERASRARRREQRVLERNPELTAEDVRIAPDGTPILTVTGREVFTEQAEQEQEQLEALRGIGFEGTRDNLRAPRTPRRELGLPDEIMGAPQTPAGRAREQFEQDVEEETGLDVRASDIEIDETADGFRASLSQAGQERLVSQQETDEEFGDADIENLGDVPFIGPTARRFAAISGVELPAVSDIPRGVRTSEAPDRVVGGAGPLGVPATRQVTGVETFAEGTDLEDVYRTVEEGYSDVASDIAAANVRMNPVAQATIDLAGTVGLGETAETSIESGTRQALELGNVAGLAVTTVETAEFADFAEQEVAAGRGGVSLREFEDVGGFGREGPLELEEEGLAPDVIEEGELRVQQAVQFAQENPAQFAGGAAGSLIASGFIFGGARAISSGASVGARAVIQPGEELAGFGGGAVTRSIAGPRAANRLFPQNEPLIFSEEAAIRGAQRVGARIQQIDRPALPGPSLGEVPDLFRGARRAAGREFQRIREPRPFLEDPAFEIAEQDLVENDLVVVQDLGGDLREAEFNDPETIADPDADPSGAGVGASGVTFEIEQRTDSGVVVEQVRAEFRDELEMEPAAESELLSEVETGRRLESNLEPIQPGAETLQESFGELTIPGVEGALRSDLGAELEPLLDPQLEPVFDREQEGEFEQELEQEFEFEMELELEQELEQESEAELEQELEFESEQESEAELERFDFNLFAEEDGAGGLFTAVGAQRVTEFGTVAESIGVGQDIGIPDDADTEQILEGPASESGFGRMPFEGDDMLDLGAPTVTGLDAPGATPPGGELPASVSNALFDERDNTPLF